MNYHIDEMISEEKVDARICELANQLNRDYAGKELHLVIILKGSIFFACELAKRITVPVTMDFMSVSSYGDGMVSAGNITIKKELDEDIVDSGNTLFHLKKLLGARGPETLKIITLLDKPDRRTADIDVDYCGFVIEDKFVVGYGLDYAQKHRNLPYIGVVVQE